MLAIKIGNRSSFNMHVTTDMTVSKNFMVMNAFFRLQFSYSLLAWMFHCRSPSIRINRLHERWFCVIYNDKHSTFQRILDQDKSVSLHSCNLKGTPLGILADIFNSRRSTNYSLHYQEQSIRPIVISLCNETETTSYLGSKTWELLPLETKEQESLPAFKSIIKICNPCLYRLCKNDVAGIGFIWSMIFYRSLYVWWKSKKFLKIWKFLINFLQTFKLSRKVTC